jgi:hypothetical protein
MTTINVAPEFEEHGIKPMVFGVPELPKAPQTNALARQIKRTGVRAHDDTQVATFDDAGAAMLAHPWAYPAQIAGQLAAPQVVSVQAGTLYLVSGLVLTPRVMPPYHNSRARSKLAIPATDSKGRVNFPWPTRDVSPDPQDVHRLLIKSQDITTLAGAAQATAEHVEAMQGKLKDLLGREGVEEQVLLVPGRFALNHGHLDYETVWLGADGGSRITIEQGFLADVIGAMLARDVKLTPKRRAGLRQLGLHLRGRVAGLLSHDPIAERDLRDELARLGTEPAADLVKSRLFQGQRALVMPARALVAFVPHGNGTVLDAVQQLIGNAHKRGPKQWDSSATAVDTRDEVLRKLDEASLLTDEELLLYGPAYEEAYELHNITRNPDYRASELVRVFHEGDPLSDQAKQATKEVLRAGRLSPQMRAQVIAGAVLEQVRDADPKRRDNIEATLNELLAHQPFFGTGVTWPSRDPEVDDLLTEVNAEHAANPRGWTPAKVELTVKGGLAMAMIGTLQRPFGTEDKEQRSYNVLARVAHSPYGHELLGAAIKAVRNGEDFIPGIDHKTKQPKGLDGNGDVIPMDGANLRELFPTPSTAVKQAQPTADGYLGQIVARLKNGVSSDIDALEQMPVVQQRGVSPSQDTIEAIELLEEYRDRLKFLVRQHKNYYSSGGDQTAPTQDADEAA